MQFRKVLAILFLISPLPIIGWAQVAKCPVKIVITDFKMVPQPGEQIWLVGQQNGKTVKGVSDANGVLIMELDGGQKYDIKVKSIGEALEYNTVEIPTLGANQRYGTLQISIKYELPKTFTLDNVLFDTGKSSLRKSSFIELDELVELMKLKEKMTIEVGGHTDSVGTDAKNMQLSQDRANVVKEYLISKGIDASRITAIGFGETMPVADNGSAEGRQQNRRTEVKVLKK